MTNSKIKILNLSKPIVKTDNTDYANSCIKYGIHNDLPLRIVSAVRRSRTGSTCISKLTDYTYANGFKSLESIKANKSDTWNTVLYKSASNLTVFGGFALHFNYNVIDGEVVIAEVKHLPFENIRLGLPNDKGEVEYLVYNPYFGTTRYSHSDNLYYGVFKPNLEDIANQKAYFKQRNWKYGGQVLWTGIESEYAHFYPKLTWHGDNNERGGGLEDMNNEYLLQNLLKRDLGGNFLQNVMLNMIGDADEPASPDDEVRYQDGKSYRTIADELEEQLSNFTGVDADTMMILWSKTKDEVADIKPFPSNFNYDKLKDVVESIKHSIATSLQVPSTLANIQSSGSISKDDIESANLLLQQTVRNKQILLEEVFNSISKYLQVDIDFKIVNFVPFKTVPQYIFNAMTLEQQQSIIDTYLQ